jgi:hypothetical protein
MLRTKYDVLVRNGKERFVLIPVKEYEALVERLEDEEDFRILQEARKRSAGKPLIPHEQIMREFGLTTCRTKRKS